MKLLLDTQIVLWSAAQPQRLSAAARSLLQNPKHDLLFSAASMWEIAIKRGLGRTDFVIDPRVLRRGLIDHGYLELAITGEHASAVDGLPPLHKDPFNRLLVAQAQIEGITLLTSDTDVARYSAPVRLV